MLNVWNELTKRMINISGSEMKLLKNNSVTPDIKLKNDNKEYIICLIKIQARRKHYDYASSNKRKGNN